MLNSKRILKAVYWFLFGNPAQRRRVRLECARIAVSLFGNFSLGDDYKTWLEDKEFRRKFKELSPISPYSEERKYVLREFARFVRNVPGCMAECGCYQGASAYFMAREYPDVPMHLFDSFEGLPEPSEHDVPKHSDERPWQQGDFLTSEQTIRKNLHELKNIFYHKGWIPDRFSDVSDKRFRLVHIDVDLYQPTKDCLNFFYPRMNGGGVIVLDDYGSTLCPGAYKATKEFVEKKPEHVLHLTTMQGVIIICRN